MDYESMITFKGKIESMNLENSSEYTRITFNQLKFNNPVLDELFWMLDTNEIVEIEIKRLVQ
jgi:hypothetical protein